VVRSRNGGRGAELIRSRQSTVHSWSTAVLTIVDIVVTRFGPIALFAVYTFASAIFTEIVSHRLVRQSGSHSHRHAVRQHRSQHSSDL
jgi:hypothetical protein